MWLMALVAQASLSIFLCAARPLSTAGRAHPLTGVPIAAALRLVSPCLTGIQAFGAALACIDGIKTSESGPGRGHRAVSAA
jgi:hypothetical protein